MQPSSQPAFGRLKFSFTGFRFFFFFGRDARTKEVVRAVRLHMHKHMHAQCGAPSDYITRKWTSAHLSYFISDLIWHGRAALLELNHPRVGPCKTLFIGERVYIQRCLISGRKCGCKHRWFALKVLPRAHKCEWLCVIDDVLEILPWQTLSMKLHTLPLLYSWYYGACEVVNWMIDRLFWKQGNFEKKINNVSYEIKCSYGQNT